MKINCNQIKNQKKYFPFETIKWIYLVALTLILKAHLILFPCLLKLYLQIWLLNYAFAAYVMEICVSHIMGICASHFKGSIHVNGFLWSFHSLCITLILFAQLRLNLIPLCASVSFLLFCFSICGWSSLWSTWKYFMFVLPFVSWQSSTCTSSCWMSASFSLFDWSFCSWVIGASFYQLRFYMCFSCRDFKDLNICGWNFFSTMLLHVSFLLTVKTRYGKIFVFNILNLISPAGWKCDGF